MDARAWVLFVAVGCGGQLPAPETTEHPLSAFADVPYPPPAALAETVPERPERDGVVWIDGEWRPHGDSYVWRRGGWFVPPTQALHADVLSRGLIRLRRADSVTVTIDAISAPLHAHDGSLIGSLTFFVPLGSS